MPVGFHGDGLLAVFVGFEFEEVVGGGDVYVATGQAPLVGLVEEEYFQSALLKAVENEACLLTKSQN